MQWYKNRAVVISTHRTPTHPCTDQIKFLAQAESLTSDRKLPPNAHPCAKQGIVNVPGATENIPPPVTIHSRVTGIYSKDQRSLTLELTSIRRRLSNSPQHLYSTLQ